MSAKNLTFQDNAAPTAAGDRGAAPGAVWRQMTQSDLPAVSSIASEVHPAYPEEGTIFAERLRLYPSGCFVLALQGEIVAYVVSHPWRASNPPSLNTLLVAIPSSPGTYYLHDIALLPGVRGLGYGEAILRRLITEAKDAGLTTMSLVAVNHSAPFWTRYGFAAMHDPAASEVLQSYGADAAFMVRDLSASAHDNG